MNSGLDYTELDKAHSILLLDENSPPIRSPPPLHADFIVASEHSRYPIREGIRAYTDSTITELASNTVDISNQFHDISTNMIKYNDLYSTMDSDKRYDFNSKIATRISADYVQGTRETALEDIQVLTENQNYIYVYTSLGLISLVAVSILMNNGSNA
jgi:hypothetical protein